MMGPIDWIVVSGLALCISIVGLFSMLCRHGDEIDRNLQTLDDLHRSYQEYRRRRQRPPIVRTGRRQRKYLR